jgi:hypothetical protein
MQHLQPVIPSLIAGNFNKLHRIVKERRDDTEIQNLLSRLSEKISLALELI